MRFFLGLILGAIVGSGGMYMALEQPWGQEVAQVAPDAGVELADDKKPKKKRKKRRRKKGDVEIEVTGDIPDLSAADRKLSWKGDTVKLPASQMDMSTGEESRSLSGSEINQVVKGQSSRMLSCITSARGNAPLESKITAKLLVDGSGKVTKSRFRAPGYLFDHGFYSCARKAAGAMRFPATGGYTVVDVPYDLY